MLFFIYYMVCIIQNRVVYTYRLDGIEYIMVDGI